MHLRSIIHFALVFFTCVVAAYPIGIEAQSMLVQPYLQNATPSTMVIMWETDVNTESTIQFGLTPTLGSTATGTNITTVGNTKLHTVELNNLVAATGYYYKSITGVAQSPVYHFITPPLRNSEQNFNIVLMSDMQKDGSNPTIFANLINTSLLPFIADTYGSPLDEHLQMAVLPGDVVDAGNAYLQYKNDFFNPGEALWSSVPCYPAIGNHEANSPNYFNYFNLPANGTPGFLEHWYCHDYSNVRVLSFDSNPTYRIEEQLHWLDSMLNVSCGDTLIDFVFAQMHHPHLSELWVPGECDYTGDILHRLETFSDNCGKPTIHFFGHTHAYSRGQSRDHQHLWVNVASSGGNIDYWGEFENKDYDEFIVSQDEYGFVMVEVTAGADPTFTLKRLSFGDQYNPGGSNLSDLITVHRYNNAPVTPLALFPTREDTVSSFCVTLQADGFRNADEEHGSTHWQVSTDSLNFNIPLAESWKQYANWYNEVDLQANDDLTDETITNLPPSSRLYWRVRYRNKGLVWSNWSTPSRFHTKSLETITGNLVQNPGGENGISNWIATTGVIESLNPLECAGINPYAGQKYFAVGALCVEFPFASANQLIDVSAYAADIDAQQVLVNFGAQLADYANTDEPSFAIQFINGSGNVISGSDTTRHRLAIWTLKQKTLFVPALTRSIRLIIMGTRFAGTDNDSYFDEIFLRLLRGDVNCSTYVAPGPAHGRIYVDKDALGYADGESWITAYRTLQAALLQSNADTLIHEIWMANGVYKPVSGASRDSSFQLSRSVDIYCGFSGNEILLTERDPIINEVVLSGEIGNPDLITDNVCQIMAIVNTKDSLVIDGLNFRMSYGNLPGHDKGGGLYVDHTNKEPVTIAHCQFENNAALEGSSIYNGSEMILDHTTILDQEIAGFTTCSILNTGSIAALTLIHSTITQVCQTFPQVIRNINGARITVIDSAEVQRN